ncbi:MAG: hypothetical protein U0Z44_00815 [Kouleothrix sp.]
MTPRTQITALPIDIPFAEALGQIDPATRACRCIAARSTRWWACCM